MIVNLLRFSFRAEITEQQRAATLAAMRRTASVDSVSFSSVGQDLGDPAEGFTHAYLAAVADLDALRRYFYDPVHLDGDHEILPTLARLYAVRLSDDPDPDLGHKISALFQEKVATYPEWGRLLADIPNTHV
ncbi:Dabb family protein [Actinophytocola oryzae]|uniref:Stress responsive alpha/beta barrel protein n=1 Tax=Actinophytocola oryzae TaxID=502181 RepID=A0A4R7URP8_9PSEU|nr:Dabb family protein [Actinophytocola oryzae]TDV37752.1 stress responsive alpha/beta barrel protein [Actinophytocola oryzae]